MENSNLTKLIRSFSAVEIREARKFLISPFFNQRDDVVRLFDWLAGGGEVHKKEAWRTLFGPAPYDDQKTRLLMSYLNSLLEQYLAVKETTSDRPRLQLQLAAAYRKRGLADAFERVRKNVEKNLAAQPLRNDLYHETRYRLLWEAHQLAYIQDPTDLSRLEQLSDGADVLYLTQKLRLICLLAAHQSVYHSGSGAGREAELVAWAEREPYASLPAVAVYLHCYHMLRPEAEERHFIRFKEILLHQAECFSEEDLHGLYILALNFCVRRINAGQTTFYKEALDLYKEGLRKNYLLHGGTLTRFTYHNIVAAGLHTNELDWVRYFINEYKNRLEKRYREAAFSFNLARLEYARQNYGFVLELLQKANYRDPLLNLAAKALLLKTYYDLGEHNLLQSHLDAMRNYIHRKRVLGYHRTNYLNIIRYTEKIMRLNNWDKKAVEKLRQALDQESILTEKTFFQKILHVME